MPFYSVPMSAKEHRILYACQWMVDNHATIRTTAKEFGYATSSFWRMIHRDCKDLSPDLYVSVQNQMDENLKHRRSRKWKKKTKN